MLEVFVHRNPAGFETADLDGIEELEEQLRGVETFGPLDEDKEITLEIKGSWYEIRQLLTMPFLQDIWFDPTRRNQM